MHLVVLTLFLSETSIAQTDSTLPLTVTIRLEKQYTARVPNTRFSTQKSGSNFSYESDSVDQDQFDVKISIENVSLKPVSFWLMTCAYWDNFEINNNYINFYYWGCDRNFPELVRLEPHQIKTIKATLARSALYDRCLNCHYGRRVETTKLGLKVIDDVYHPKLDAFEGYWLAINDESTWRMIWSNPLYLLKKTEASTN